MMAHLVFAMTISLWATASLHAQAVPAPSDSAKADTASSPPTSQETFTEIDEYPTPIKKVAPVYPIGAQMRKITGKVLVKVLVGKEGVPIMADIYKSDAAELEEAATDAVMKWRFKPAILKGAPVEYWVVIPFQFNLAK